MDEEKEEMTWDTADVKTCPHGFVFRYKCDKCTPLKPCPFCGERQSPPDLWEDGLGFWRIGCGGCGSHSGVNRDMQKVIDLWNKRA